jgi:hypothetical protein
MKIEFINPPFVFTDDGKRIHFDNIKGQIFKGSTLKAINETDYEVTGSEVDPDCVGGVCPVK